MRALILILPVLLLYWPVLTGGQLAFEDRLSYYVWRAPLREMCWQWTPLEFAGSPILGDIQRAVFYPLSFPFYLLPAGPAISLSLILHSLLACAGVYFLARELEIEPPAASLAAVAFTLGFWPVFRVSIVTMNAVLAWLPWLAWATCRLFRRPSPGVWAALAVFSALQWLAGHPQLVYYTYLALAAIALSYVRQPGWLKRSAALAVALGLGLGLAAPQVWPAVLVSRQTLRAQGISLQAAATYSITPKMLWTAVSPYAFGLKGVGYPGDAPGPLWALTMGPDAQAYQGDWSLQETCLYPGLVAWLFILVALRERRSWALAAGALFTLWLGLGLHGGLFQLYYRLVPGADQFRTPSRITLLTALALALLAGIGWQRNPSVKLRAALAAGLTALAWLAPGSKLLVVWPILMLWVAAVGPRNVALLALTLDLAWVGHGYLRTVDTERQLPPVLTKLAAVAGNERVAIGTAQAGIPGSAVLAAPLLGLHSVQGWNPIALGHYVETLYFNETGHFPTSQAERDQLVIQDHLFMLGRPVTPLTELLGVRYVLGEGPRILENPRALPRAWLVERLGRAQGEDALRAVQEGRVDPRQEVLLETGGEGGWLNGPHHDPPGEVKIFSQGCSYLSLKLTLERPALLVTNLIYEPGWKVYFDRHQQPSAPVLRAFHSLMAVRVFPDVRSVRFEYEPPGLTEGLIMAAVSVLLLALGLLGGRLIAHKQG